jgi:L-gulonolactone oxidase
MNVEFGWKNWVGNQRSDAAVVAPRTLEKLIEAVVRDPHEQPAPAGGGDSGEAPASRRIRAAGGGYSWSPLVPDSGLIIDCQHLDRELNADKNPPNIIEVECGMTIETLTEKVRKRGMSTGHPMTLVSPTLFPRPTVGGAIAPGCHGTGSGTGGFADQIVEMTIVKADGSVETIDSNHADMPAARVALGTFGIIYSVKIALVPAFNVITEIRKLPIDTVLGELPQILKSYEFLEFFWFPFQQNMCVFLMNRTDAPPDPKTWWTKLSTKLQTALEDTMSRTLIPWIATKAPRLTPILSKLASSVAFREQVKVQTSDDAFHFQHSYPKCWDCSYSVPVEHAPKAWRTAIELVNEYADAHLYPINLAVHGRFTGKSTSWIAPDYGRPTAYVEVTAVKATRYWKSFFRNAESRWTQLPGARPHWSKLYWDFDRLYDQYERMDSFLEARERWDPERVFLNEFLEKQVFKLPEREPPTEPPHS